MMLLCFCVAALTALVAALGWMVFGLRDRLDNHHSRLVKLEYPPEKAK